MDKANVLIVDDEPRVTRTLERLLKPHFKVHVANSGRDALEIIKYNRIHVVLSDQRMPEMSGVELLQNIRQLSSNTTRILLTGYSDLDAVVNSVNQSEIFRYITKPWNNEELIQTLRLGAEIAQKLFAAEQQELTVEDRPTTVLTISSNIELELILERLVNRKSRLVSVQNIAQAQKLFDEGRSIDIIIIMPQEDMQAELKWLNRIKSQHPHVLSIVILEKADIHYLVDMINNGQIYRFLYKPFALGQLKIFLMSALRHQKKLRQHPELAQRYKVQNIEEESKTASESVSWWHRLRNLFHHTA